MSDLTGKVCLVTGGSRGLGREMVLAFAERGADVVIASRKLAACEALAAEVHEKYGVRALGVACNVGDWSQCDDLVEQVYADFGRIDVLVNNAGMSPLYPSLEEVSEDLWDKVLGINLKGPFRLTAAVGKRMADGNGGTVINVSSIASIRPDALSLPYAAAKAGLNALTEGFAQAYAPTVRVNAILCGPFLTDISKAWPEDIHQFVAQSLALGRAGRPDEVVGAALYFASEASSFTTGAILRVDGGTR
ncbi:MAG: family NAD(P)-dependent oxidoreductase [Marmoricola sp.]|nr:family NAD(P)-dependent oxidoreductase [Marmoricola sp.]